MKISNTPGRKLILISMLPGLGKSTLAKNITGVVDYEDWMEGHGLDYKTEHKPSKHLYQIIKENYSHDEDIIIFSSIHWDRMKDKYLKSGLLIHMKHGEYNKEELDFRGRSDIPRKFKDIFENWNADYYPLALTRKSYELPAGKFVDLKMLRDEGYLNDYLLIEDDEIKEKGDTK